MRIPPGERRLIVMSDTMMRWPGWFLAAAAEQRAVIALRPDVAVRSEQRAADDGDQHGDDGDENSGEHGRSPAFPLNRCSFP